MKKIYINPKVPIWMDDKPIDQRSETHLAKWFNRPYIRTTEFIEDTYEEYLERMSGSKNLETEEEFNARREEDFKEWCEWWGEDGIRYDVRILDGGAWDRTTNKGSYKTLEEAMKVAQDLMNGPSFMDKVEKNTVFL